MKKQVINLESGSPEEERILDWADKQGFTKMADKMFGLQSNPPMQPYVFERIRAAIIRFKAWWRR